MEDRYTEFSNNLNKGIQEFYKEGHISPERISTLEKKFKNLENMVGENPKPD